MRTVLFEPQFEYIHIPDDDFKKIADMIKKNYGSANYKSLRCDLTDGCQFWTLDCADIEKQETVIEISVGDSHKDQSPYKIKFVLEDEMRDFKGHCYFPIHPLPPSDMYQHKDREVWYLGRMILRKYFTVYDNRPAEFAFKEKQNEEVVNDVGISECQAHTDRLSTTKNWDLVEEGEDGKSGGSGGVIAALLICVFLALGTIAFCKYKKKQD